MKLANMLFMAELHRRLPAGASTISVAAGPPGTKTDGMQAAIASIRIAPLRWVADTVTDAIMLSPEQGMAPVVRAATDPDAAGGEYYAPAGFLAMRGVPEATQPEGVAADAELAPVGTLGQPPVVDRLDRYAEVLGELVDADELFETFG